MAISGVNGFEPRMRGSHRRERLEQAKTQEGALGRAHLAPAAAVRRSQEFSDFNDGLNSISLRQRNRRKGNTGASTPQWHFLPRRPHSKRCFFFFFFFHSVNAFAPQAMIGYLISRAGKYPRALWSSRIPFLSQHWGFIKTRSLSAAVN